MHEKVKHLFAQINQRQEEIRQNKFPLQLLSLLLPILLNVSFSIGIFAIDIVNNSNRYF